MPNAMSRRHLFAATAGALTSPAILGRAHAAGETVQLISHRYPGLEFYADKMKSALPGVAVDTRLMQAATRFSCSGWPSPPAPANGPSVGQQGDDGSFAKAGWLEPLDDLWAKYRDKFNLGDISQSWFRAVPTRAGSTACR